MAQMLSHRATHVWVTESDSAENTLVGVVSYVDILCAVTKTPATMEVTCITIEGRIPSNPHMMIVGPIKHDKCLKSHSSLQRTPGRRRRVIYAATPPSIINLPCRSLFRYSFRSPQSPKDAHTIVNSLAKSVRKTLTVAIFTAAFALVPFPGGRIFPAIATPTVVEKNEKGETLTDHEFSGYTRRLLSVVSVLLRRIEDVKSGKGDMNGVNDALGVVKANKRKIQDEVIGNLNAELKELKTAKMELIRRSEEVLDLALAAMKEEGWLLRNDEQKNKRPRELSFIEKESELLVQSFSRWMVEFKHGSQQKNYPIAASVKDIQMELEAAQKDYWEQKLLPTVLEIEDSGILWDSNTQAFTNKIEQALKESQQMQKNLETQIRRKFKKFGDEKCFLVNTPEEEVLKGFPEVELKWMFGTKEIIVPKAVRVHLFHGWKKWREQAKANLKKQLLENINHGRQYLVQRQEHILLDRERLVAKTWYNDERKRWEMDPVAVPYAVSKKLMESARIRFDWAVMYVTLKGDDKEYFVDIKEFDLLFEDFGGFDGLYMRMIASGIRTVVQLMWIPLSDLDMHQQYLLIKIFPILEFIIPKQVRMSIGMAWPEEAHQAVDSTWYLKWQCEAEVRHRARKRDSFIWYLWFFIKSYVYVVVLFNVIQFLWKVPWLLGHGGLRRKDPNLRKLRRLDRAKGKDILEVNSSLDVPSFFGLFHSTVISLRENKGNKNAADANNDDVKSESFTCGISGKIQLSFKRDRDPIRSVFNQMKRVKNPPIPLSEFSIVESLRDEINDIVTFLQNPRAFSERGARAPRGVLIVGEPNRKTSLALAIAAEAKVPVVEVKASQLERKVLKTRMVWFYWQQLIILNKSMRHCVNQVVWTGVLRLQRLTQMEREKILHLAAKETMDHDLIDFVDWKKDTLLPDMKFLKP
ncbi:hypothetical protein HPP92_003200 [Vanilla planifolia]|uniref:Uncharacterized protein n=1 Tax=Vanilla planifolia TaxID=51239 RepID=A0A835RZJ1_VANPL|nr:hypothetical protein HPP92_003200 [Vanilla planifolia]